MGTKGDHPLLQRELNRIANKYRVRKFQVLNKWLVQQGIGIVPRSRDHKHLRENLILEGITLSKEDLEALNMYPQTQTGGLKKNPDVPPVESPEDTDEKMSCNLTC